MIYIYTYIFVCLYYLGRIRVYDTGPGIAEK